MSGKIFKSVVLFFVGIMSVCSSQAFAGRLAQGEYAGTNGSFKTQPHCPAAAGIAGSETRTMR